MALVRELRFDASCDQLWFVGDLVNRGPDNANVLRWVKSLGEAATVVLGNHDVHLLSQAAGVQDTKAGDTLSDVLNAPDRDELIEWLRTRPVVWFEGDDLLVHAGVPPSWSLESIRQRAGLLEAALSGDRWRDALFEIRGFKAKAVLADAEPGNLGATAAALQRLRTIDANGRWADFSGPLQDAPSGLSPWFDLPHQHGPSTRVLFGHWAALGLLVRDDVVCLDSGCVWGRGLTAFDRETGTVVSVPNCEQR